MEQLAAYLQAERGSGPWCCPQWHKFMGTSGHNCWPRSRNMMVMDEERNRGPETLLNQRLGGKLHPCYKGTVRGQLHVLQGHSRAGDRVSCTHYEDTAGQGCEHHSTWSPRLPGPGKGSQGHTGHLPHGVCGCHSGDSAQPSSQQLRVSEKGLLVAAPCPGPPQTGKCQARAGTHARAGVDGLPSLVPRV